MFQLIQILLVWELVWLSLATFLDQWSRIEMLFWNWLVRLGVVWRVGTGKLCAVDSWLLRANNYRLCVMVVLVDRRLSTLHWLWLGNRLYLTNWLTLLLDRTYCLSWLCRLGIAGSTKSLGVVDFGLLSLNRPTN